jgi:DNA-binding XRE family transcriptional regulator
LPQDNYGIIYYRRGLVNSKYEVKYPINWMEGEENIRYPQGTMAYKINDQLGAKIARERKRQNMTQEFLAHKAKIQTTTLSNIERGETDTSVYTVYKIADALKMHIKELFIFR